MFPLIYEKNETAFNSNGLGALSECIRCEVTEELNGIFEMEFDVPITARHYYQLKARRLIYAMTPGGKQPFEIYRISKPINGVVTVYCQHISYRLLKMTASLFSSPTCAAAGAELATQATTAEGATWTFWTDKDIHSMYRVAYPKTIRNCFGGEQGSMIQLFGGELEFDHRTIKLHTHRGADNGVEIRYAKNMSDITDDDNAADVYKSVIPYYYQEGGNCIVGTKVSKTAAFDASFDLTIPLDCTGEFQAEPTAAQLTAYAQTYIDARTPTVSDETITVSFVPLAGYSGYEGLDELETVNIGDTVTVINPVLGISTQKKANKYTFDALNERYISVELGAKKSTLGKTISDELGRELDGVNNQLAGKVSETEMNEAIEAATDLITGGTGGYVFTGRNNDGEPNEIFIMDTNNTVTAVNVIRLNNNGIGFSHNGINGPFSNAWTIDGHLIADYIYTGTLQSKDANANFSLNMTTGAVNMKDATITGGSLTTENGLYTNIISNGTLECYYNNSVLGSVGVYDFINDKHGMLLLIKSYNADRGGIGILSTDPSSLPPGKRVVVSQGLFYETKTNDFNCTLPFNCMNIHASYYKGWNGVAPRFDSGATFENTLFFDSTVNIQSSNGLSGLNSDNVGIALFNKWTGTGTGYVRANANGSIDIYSEQKAVYINAAGGVYVNGTRIG